MHLDTFWLINIFGPAMFAVSGAMSAGRKHLDITGVVAAATYVASDGHFLTRPLRCLVFLAGMGLERLLPGGRAAQALGKR